MRRLHFLPPLVAVSLFAAALVDLLLDFGLFGPAAAAVLFALSLASLLYLVRSPSRAGWAPVALLAGASFAFGIRALGDEASPLRPPSLSFHEARDRDADGGEEDAGGNGQTLGPRTVRAAGHMSGAGRHDGQRR